LRPNRSLKRVLGGLGLLVAIAAIAALSTTAVFAFSTATDTNDSTNGVSNGTGAISVSSLLVTSTAQVIASYTANNVSVVQGTGTSTVTNIRTMYQQWRHEQQNDWFYVYAQNGATSVTTPTWDYYYYNPMRGVTRINSVASALNSVSVVGSAGLQTSVSFVYLTSGTNVPAFAIESISATIPECPRAGVAGSQTCSNNRFSVELRWGIGQHGFRDENNAGTVALLQAVETFPYPAGGIGTSRTFYDGWEPVNASAPTITLGDNAPTQTSVTNASGARNVNTASAYESVQTVGDVDGDLSRASLIWMRANGEWYQAGAIYQRNTGGYSLAGVATAFYESWNEAVTYTSSGSQITTNFFSSLRVTPTVTLSDRGGGQNGHVSSSITYAYIYSSAAAGSVTLFGIVEDFHGRNTGNIGVGTQTIS
jgi:hypothetical protein